jgi:hypothetical protein
MRIGVIIILISIVPMIVEYLRGRKQQTQIKQVV